MQVSFQHEGEELLLFVVRLPHGKSTGDVSCSLQVVSAGVRQQQGARLNGDVGFLGGRIVDDGAMRTIGDNRREGRADVIRAFAAELF